MQWITRTHSPERNDVVKVCLTRLGPVLCVMLHIFVHFSLGSVWLSLGLFCIFLFFSWLFLLAVSCSSASDWLKCLVSELLIIIHMLDSAYTFTYLLYQVPVLHCALSCTVYCNCSCLCVCLWVRLTTASTRCLYRLWALSYFINIMQLFSMLPSVLWHLACKNWVLVMMM